jgi:hypothetical protein
MKTYLLFFLLLVSFNSHALVICIDDSGDPDSCVDQGTSSGQSVDGVSCYYNKDLGITQCNTVLGDGSLGGYWDPKTFTCSNFVAPKVGSTGEITCPASDPVSIKSKTTPDPSKDDKACDPSKGADSGCASQETAAKTNDLLSETNSKLGSISGSSAATTGLLGQILGTLRGIASQGTVGTGGDTGGGGDGGDGTGGTGDGVTTTDKSVSFSKSFGSSGSCPVPESFSVLGGSYSFSYQPLCDLATSMRGIVISIGAFSALLIVVTAL